MNIAECLLAYAIHYPECWDTACYPTVLDAMDEIKTEPDVIDSSGRFRCTNQDCCHPSVNGVRAA